MAPQHRSKECSLIVHRTLIEPCRLPRWILQRDRSGTATPGSRTEEWPRRRQGIRQAVVDREYLHVSRERLVFDISGASIGRRVALCHGGLTEETACLNPLLKLASSSSGRRTT
jgi:hypothetical protein